MIHIDGTFGEGGGQILRSSLGLSLVTGKPFTIDNIRGKRKKTGLLRQHLTAVNAAVKISNAQVEGNSMGSTSLKFVPQKVIAGNYHFAVGSAGSAALVLQAVLPALLIAEHESSLIIEGGTHNPFAPPFDFLLHSFLPVLRMMGIECNARIERYGFYPAGGGRYLIDIKPKARLKEITLCEHGVLKNKRVAALYAKLPEKIAQQEISIIKRKLHFSNSECIVSEVPSQGPGNAVVIAFEYDYITYVATAFGLKNVPLQDVARKAVAQTKAYLESGAVVCEHLADQLLIPMALAGRGAYTCVKPSMHTKTNIEIIRKFLDVEIETGQVSDTIWKVTVRKKSGVLK